MADNTNNASSADTSSVTAIKVKVVLDTTTEELKNQFKGVQNSFKKAPVEIAFGVNEGATIGNVNAALKRIIKKVESPKLTLKIDESNIDAAVKKAVDKAQSGAKNAKAEVKVNLNTNEAKQKLDAFYRRVQEKGSLYKDALKLESSGKNQPELEEVLRQLQAVRNEAGRLRTELVNILPTEEFSKISEIERATTNSISRLEARLQGLKNAANDGALKALKKSQSDQTNTYLNNLADANNKYKNFSGASDVKSSLADVQKQIDILNTLETGTQDYVNQLKVVADTWADATRQMSTFDEAQKKAENHVKSMTEQALKWKESIKDSDTASQELRDSIDGIIDASKKLDSDHSSDAYKKGVKDLDDAFISAKASMSVYTDGYKDLESTARRTLTEIRKKELELEQAGNHSFDSVLIGDSKTNSLDGSLESQLNSLKGMNTQSATYKQRVSDIVDEWLKVKIQIEQALKSEEDLQKEAEQKHGQVRSKQAAYNTILQLSKFFGDNKDLMDNLVDKNGNINLNTEAFKKATLDELDKRIKAANETGGAAATALANSLSSDKANIESGKISVSDYLVGLGTDLERVNTELDKYQTNWSTLKDAMDEWNTTGQLTQDTMQKLQELPEEFSNLLTYDEDGNAKIDVKALRQSYVDKLSAFAKEFEGSPIGIQVQAMIDDVREPTLEEYKALAEKTVKYQKALAQYTKKMSAIDSNKDLSEDEALKQKAEVQKELDDALEKALLEVQETDAQVTTKLKKHWDGVEKVIEEFKSALSDAKAVLSSFLSLLSTLNDKSNNDLKIWGDAMGKVIDKRIEALNKQKEALEENNEATERAIELSKAQDALARAQQQRTTRVYTENGYEWQANAEDVRTAREDLADKQREWNNKDAEKAIDDQIKKYNEFKDKLSEVMDDIGKSWKDYQKELEYTAQIQKMTITQMEGSLDGYHNKIIASLNTGSAITSIQNLIANLESLINTLTKVNNLYSMVLLQTQTTIHTRPLLAINIFRLAVSLVKF